MTSYPAHQHLKELLSALQTPYRQEMFKKDIDFIIGRRLRALRLKQSLNGTQMGRILGISQQQVSRYENGMNSLSPAMMVTLCVYFNISLECFLSPLISVLEKDNADNEEECTSGGVLFSSRQTSKRA